MIFSRRRSCSNTLVVVRVSLWTGRGVREATAETTGLCLSTEESTFFLFYCKYLW